ncbi:hypothetical protein [Mycobacterium sp. Marseille-P9652]|uniref:hypothetical protein n=1 Tax=Mycobacterium sp. Marseille-P9652 TaxID=2654950 RepID=UPI0012E726B6|nr:hypothetical protein [Mycobacterium sp. Marseille-P9652]
MAASGHTTSGYGAALLIGVLLLLALVASTTARIMHAYRARGNETADELPDRLSDQLPSDMGPSLWRCQALIAEAIIIRQRLSGEIDAETYQTRMNALACQASSARRPQRNV